uniref:minor capsid protein n=1 Tax=Dialister sp. TaxID=1955814 RepID=UPI004025F566
MDKQSENEAYWAARAAAYEEAWHKKCQETIEMELAAYYEQALADIQNDIAALYGRFAKDNKISLADAHKLLTGAEFRIWRMSLEEYIKSVDEGTVLSKELDTLAMRSRISRLDKLYAETLKALDRLGRKTEDRMTDFLMDAYKDRFYHGIYDVAERTGIMKANVAIDDDTAQKIAAAPWSGKSYSQRIWKNDQQLGAVLRTVVSNGLHRGLSVPQMAKMVEDKMHAGLSNARRLVRTEMNYVQNRAAADSIKESGMKYYRFIATMDRRTSSMCRAHDGKVYPINEYRPGGNAPPLHPNCRSTIAGSLRDVYNEDGTRTARNYEKKTIHVPKNMTYESWYNTYIEPRLVPTGEGKWPTRKDGTIIATKYAQSAHQQTPSRGLPNSVVMHQSNRNDLQYDFDFYDSNGFMAVQIHCGPHGNSKKHPFGEVGEHMHIWQWKKKPSGKWAGSPDKGKELGDREREWMKNEIEAAVKRKATT